MSPIMTSANPFAVLDPQASNKASSASKTSTKASGNQSEKTDGQAAKPARVFTETQIIAYEERKAWRAQKAEQAAIDAAKLSEQKPKPKPCKKGRKVFTKEETDAYEARKVARAAREAMRAKEQVAYEERCRRRAEYEERKAEREKRAEQKAAYEARCIRRAEKAAYEEREAKRQARNKKDWMTECLRTKACFNCGSQEHQNNDCPAPPWEGKY